MNKLNTQATCQINVQFAINDPALPSANTIQQWIALVYAAHPLEQRSEITVRLVDNDEMIDLNENYRHKTGTTNVLSFPFNAPAGINCPFLGDIVVCIPTVHLEAVTQHKDFLAHLAHLIIHGTLHLMGYDHIDEKDAIIMEALEIKLLAQLEIDDPYFVND